MQLPRRNGPLPRKQPEELEYESWQSHGFQPAISQWHREKAMWLVGDEKAYVSFFTCHRF